MAGAARASTSDLENDDLQHHATISYYPGPRAIWHSSLGNN